MASSPFTSVYLMPEIVNCLKLATLLVVLSVPLVGVITSPVVLNFWVHPVSLPSFPTRRSSDLNGPRLPNDHAPLVASVSVVLSSVSSLASTTPGLSAVSFQTYGELTTELQ